MLALSRSGKLIHRIVLDATALAVAAAITTAAPVRAQTTLTTPGTSGDQLIFIYDARGNRVPFMVVSNASDVPVVVETAFYDETMSLITTEVATIPAEGNLPTIDPTDQSRFPGVAGTAGLAVVTTVVSEEDLQPIVWAPPVGSNENEGPLFGGFTLANLDLGAGFGQNPFARRAVLQTGERAQGGTIVDGIVVAYERFAPHALSMPFFFNPQNLSPPEQDGNRILLAAFADAYDTGGGAFRIGAPTPGIDLRYRIQDAAGTRVAELTALDDPLTVNGLRFENLQSLAGSVELSGPGSMYFFGATPSAPLNLFGLASQALGTFAVGQRLPGRSGSLATHVGRGTVPCQSGFDSWVFSNRGQQAQNVTIEADTVSAATTGTLRLFITCLDDDSPPDEIESVTLTTGMDCTFPPPASTACPKYTTTHSSLSYCTIFVQSGNVVECVSGDVVEYELSVTSGRRLTQFHDE